ncbi:endopeptidase La [Buchnera aphidicola (Taiwanaphis decaspermi)]|uniref:endopeptidase La n=1 Tax=Buchnera aphidicola TaxID=9 RepID=UPI0031B857F7
MSSDNSEYIDIPVLPLRDVVIYPHMVVPLFVGREKSIKCIQTSMSNDKKIMLVAQKEASKDEPQIDDLFMIGTISSILQIIKLPDGTVKVLVEGLNRAEINNLVNNGDYFIAKVKLIISANINSRENEILIRTIINQFNSYIKLNKKIPQEILNSLNNINDIDRLIDTISAHIPLKLKDKQSILEISNINKRLEYLMTIIESEIDLMKVEKSIRNRVKDQMEKSQREYYLNEQVKAIQKELGEIEDVPDEYDLLKKKIESSKMTKEAKLKTKNELYKLRMMSPLSAEATVIRSYIDWMTQIPWNKRSKLKTDLNIAKTILDNDHYGLNKIKERILEYLAVQTRMNKIKGPILCLVGPPGVGKTSLGKSISKATGRKYIRMALGGIRDEAEIRGHRRTYIGSLPGKIIQKISKSKVKNPLFLLDEIDKMSCDIRVDPSSALLEVLDPEQNKNFNDNYLEVDYDLSEVMFIATANSLKIPSALLDRMEIIRISGYTEEEKLNIAVNYLKSKQIKRNALKNDEITITKNSILNIIRYYTLESGVRSLEREISKICRKVVKSLLLNKSLSHVLIKSNNLKNYLGVKKFTYGKAKKNNRIGEVTGLAWTEAGGDLLTIETVCISGKGKLSYTGSLGDVMQESIQAALTVVRSKYEKLNIDEYFYDKKDIHVHIPEGSTPKDGPSAGISVFTSLVSALTSNPVRSDIAMTGEITLSGKILPIGGLKEKLLAAHRGGIKKILIPKKNSKDLEKIPSNVLSNLCIYKVNNVLEVLVLSLEKNPYIHINNNQKNK